MLRPQELAAASLVESPSGSLTVRLQDVWARLAFVLSMLHGNVLFPVRVL